MKKLIVFVMAFLFVFSVFGDISEVEKLKEYSYMIEILEKYDVEYEIIHAIKDNDLGERSESELFLELADLEETMETLLLFNGIISYECWPPQTYPYYYCKAVVAGSNHAGVRFREVRYGVTYGIYFVDKGQSSIVPHTSTVPTWLHGGWTACGILWRWLYIKVGDYWVWVRSTYGTEYCDQITFL